MASSIQVSCKCERSFKWIVTEIFLDTSFGGGGGVFCKTSSTVTKNR